MNYRLTTAGFLTHPERPAPPPPDRPPPQLLPDEDELPLQLLLPEELQLLTLARTLLNTCTTGMVNSSEEVSPQALQ